MDIAIIIILCIALGTLLNVHVKKNRKYKIALNAKEDWLTSFSRTLDGLRNVIENANSRPDWSGNFCSMVMHEFGSDGAILYFHPNGDHDVTHVKYMGGICRDWNLVLSTETHSGARGKKPSDSNRTRIHFEPEIPSDFYWSRQPNIYLGDDIDPWLPPIFDKNIQSAIATPLKTDHGDAYLLLLRLNDKNEFNHDDQVRLNHCISIAEAGFTVIQACDERERMERELQTAHEEGMLQISTGIIHNIGNGITVIQLALERMKNGELETLAELASFIEKEILTVLREKLADGTLQDFLTNDPQGQEYFGALEALAEQIPKMIGENKENVAFVIDKFRNVTEVITLQQQFIGELGTENVCSINVIIADVLTMCQDALDQSSIKLVQELKAKHRILVDTAMLRHMILLLMKYAIEAAASSRRSDQIVKIETDEFTEEDGRILVGLSIFDNGAGRDVLPDEDELLLDRRNVDEQARNLIFIKRRIHKYGGTFEIKSEFGMGSRITIKLPSFETPEKADDGE